MGTENDRWRCIVIVLQASTCKGFYFILCSYKEVISFGSDTFDNSYLDLTFSAGYTTRIFV